MVHNDKFKIESEKSAGSSKVHLKGVIDEDAAFEEISKLQGPLTFDFSEVTSINSCGIRNWVNFLKTLKDRSVTYVQCPPLIVRQLNMVPSFGGTAKVKSVYAAYVCDQCDHEKQVLITDDQFAVANPKVPETIPCESCGKGEMEFDGHPQQYFSFKK